MKGSIPPATQLPKLTLASIAGLLVFIFIAGWLSHNTWVVRAGQIDLEQRTLEQTKAKAALIGLYLKHTQNQLDSLVLADAIVGAVDANQRAEALSHAISKGFPDAIHWQAVPTGAQTEDDSLRQSLSFIELDMINSKQKTRIVNPEIIGTGKARKLLLVSHLKSKLPGTPDNESTSFGTLLIHLPTEPLFKLIRIHSPNMGKTQLLHGPGMPFFSAGDGLDEQKQRSTIDYSDWTLSFAPSLLLVAETTRSSASIITITAVIGLFLLVLTYWVTGKFDPARIAGAALFSRARNAPETTTFLFQKTTFNKQDILDADVKEEDIELLGFGDEPENTLQQPDPDESVQVVRAGPVNTVTDHIFRAYDIRGLAHVELTPEAVMHIGQAIGSAILDAGESTIHLARDGRTHGPEITAQLTRGIISTGCHVIDLGAVPTPLLYFACHDSNDCRSGVMVTASHNPGSYNGFKVMLNQAALSEADIQALKQRIRYADFHHGAGDVKTFDILPDYIERILADVALTHPLKLVIDAGNGITGAIAPKLFSDLGCEVEPLFCEVDGNFPNHEPDPTKPENLQALIEKVQQTSADLGIAFDGDGDRLMVVTPQGEIIWSDRLLMLFVSDIVPRHPGTDVIFDVKSTRALSPLINECGGRPVMWQTGHSKMKAKMRETGALIGGEQSGHIYIKERWYGFDDGMYVAARLLEIITRHNTDISTLLAMFPPLPVTPEIQISVADDKKFALIDALINKAQFPNSRLQTIDGLRVEFAEGWGLVRASNTSANITLRFEATNEGALKNIQALFRDELLKLDNDLAIPF